MAKPNEHSANVASSDRTPVEMVQSTEHSLIGLLYGRWTDPTHSSEAGSLRVPDSPRVGRVGTLNLPPPFS